MQPTTENTYYVLGDLGSGKYIVRFYAQQHVVDEELTASSLAELKATCESRLDELAGNRSISKIGQHQPTGIVSEGHAVVFPETEQPA